MVEKLLEAFFEETYKNYEIIIFLYGWAWYDVAQLQGLFEKNTCEIKR